jgi:hypothetical protein
VKLDTQWRKATASAGQGACVEVRESDAPGVIELRESDAPGVVVRTTAANWAAFLDGAQRGEFGDQP